MLLSQRAEKQQAKAAAETKRKLDEATAHAAAANKAAAAGKQPGIKDTLGGQSKEDVRAPAAVHICLWGQTEAVHAPWALAMAAHCSCAHRYCATVLSLHLGAA